MAVSKPTVAMPRPTPLRPVPTPINSPAYEPPKPPEKKGPAAWRLKVAKVTPWLLAAFLSGLVFQVFLAGYGLQELGGETIQHHRDFSHVIELLPLSIILFGFLGADKWAGIGGIALFLMFGMQYAFIESEDPILRALHPTNGVLILALTLGLLLTRPLWHKVPPTPATDGKM